MIGWEYRRCSNLSCIFASCLRFRFMFDWCRSCFRGSWAKFSKHFLSNWRMWNISGYFQILWGWNCNSWFEIFLNSMLHSKATLKRRLLSLGPFSYEDKLIVEIFQWFSLSIAAMFIEINLIFRIKKDWKDFFSTYML